MRPKTPQLIVALDVSTFEEARALIDRLSPAVNIFKVGSQLFTSCGPVAVRYLQAKGKEVFLDLKYHDIPNTVARAVDVASRLVPTGQPQPGMSFDKSILMYTLHIIGGEEMLVQAMEAGTKAAEALKIRRPLALGITVLTSQANEDNIQALVLERALLAKRSGLDGVVCSVHEAPAIRRECGEDFVIVTPGIRPLGQAPGDQKRVATAAMATEKGSDYLVVGRPVVQAADPLKAAQEILQELPKSA